MLSKRQRLSILGAAGGVVALCAAIGGTVMAQTPGASPSPTPNAAQQQHQAQREQFLSDLAHNLGIDVNKLKSGIQATENQEIDAAVQNGKLTQDQANRLKQAVADGRLPFGPGPFAGGPARFAEGLPANIRQAAEDAVSKALGGETPAQIMQDLRSGKSFDQIAQQHSTSVQAVQSAVVSAVQPLLDQAVQAGTITASQEQAILDRIKNGKGFGFGIRGGGPRGPRGGNGPRNAAPSGTPGATQ